MTMLTGAAGDGLLDKDNTDGGVAARQPIGDERPTNAEMQKYERQTMRFRAMEHAMGLARMGWGTDAAGVVANAKVLEAYLAGTDTETAPAT